MSLPSPQLDERNLQQLLDEARRRIRQSCPEWTDLSSGDPGIMLLELFAFLTDRMIQRLNRLPEKAFIEFLRLLGVTLRVPTSAEVTLRFSLSRTQDQPFEIPQGTRVTIGRGGSDSVPPIFITVQTRAIPCGATSVEIQALHAEWIRGELAGKGNGMPGLTVQARRPPIIAPTGNELDLRVGVEATAEDLGERARAIQYNGKAYRIWREVENFSNPGPDRFVYVVDRMTGTISFAPALYHKKADNTLAEIPRALAEVVPDNREIRLWYLHGGGPAGNLAPEMLTVLKDPLPGVQVTNPAPAVGGRVAESLANALLRGPQELHSLQRAVTATDFEWVALRSSGAVSRAMAFTKSSIWAHATPGTVAVVLVPELPEEQVSRQSVTLEDLQSRQTETVRRIIQENLDERRPLGTTCLVNWARIKKVSVHVSVGLHPEEDPQAVRERVLQRLHQSINPLPTPVNPNGWPFGQPLRASNVYDIVLSEPGVSYVDQVRLRVDEVPENEISAITVDTYQPRTWYAATKKMLFRSMNDGDGWEAIGRFPDETLVLVDVHPGYPGLLAAITQTKPKGGESRIYISYDCGENWKMAAQTGFRIRNLAWILREKEPLLFMATDVGLYELSMQPDAGPIQVLVQSDMQEQGYYAVISAVDIRGTAYVALAARAGGGVFLSSRKGQPGSFHYAGFKKEQVRVLAIQRDGLRSFLWAGLAATGNEEGQGCYRLELTGSAASQEGWRQFKAGWSGGSCFAIAFQGLNIVAATHHGGILILDPSKSGAEWEKPSVNCGLPTRSREFYFEPVRAVAADPEGRQILGGGPDGVYCSKEGRQYHNISSKEFADKVTLPQTWLFCSGQHEIESVKEDETH